MKDINQATAQELQKIKGIGAVTAKRIVDSREEKGGFESLEDLRDVSGVGAKSFANLKEEFCTEGENRVDNGNDNLVKVSFNAEEYNLGELGEVHLVGDMNDWNPADKTYSLDKQEYGIWEGYFDLDEGIEYKVMYDSMSWEEEKNIGDYHDTNFVIRK